MNKHSEPLKNFDWKAWEKFQEKLFEAPKQDFPMVLHICNPAVQDYLFVIAVIRGMKQSIRFNRKNRKFIETIQGYHDKRPIRQNIRNH